MEKRAVRVFLDSNVILSGLISDKGAPRIILDILSLGLPSITGVTDRYNLIEIERNLKKKAPDVLPAYRHYFLKMNLTIAPLPSAEEVRRYAGHLSEKDVPVLVSAIKAKADFLVTGDKKDFNRLLKNSHLLRSPRPSSLQRTSKYASLLSISGASHLDIFDQPYKQSPFQLTVIKLKGRGDYSCVIVTPAEFLETILPAIIKGERKQG